MNGVKISAYLNSCSSVILLWFTKDNSDGSFSAVHRTYQMGKKWLDSLSSYLLPPEQELKMHTSVCHMSKNSVKCFRASCLNQQQRVSIACLRHRASHQEMSKLWNFNCVVIQRTRKRRKQQKQEKGDCESQPAKACSKIMPEEFISSHSFLFFLFERNFCFNFIKEIKDPLFLAAIPF